MGTHDIESGKRLGLTRVRVRKPSHQLASGIEHGGTSPAGPSNVWRRRPRTSAKADA